MKKRMKNFLIHYSAIHKGQAWIIAHIWEKQNGNDTSKKFLQHLKSKY